MSDKGQTRKDQVRFLQALREGERTLGQVLRKTRITRARLSKWLTGEFFHDAVNEILCRLRAVGELEDDLLTEAARVKEARWLTSARNTEGNQKKVQKMRTKGSKKQREKKRQETRKPKPKAHPDTSAKQSQELMRRMELVHQAHQKPKGTRRGGR